MVLVYFAEAYISLNSAADDAQTIWSRCNCIHPLKAFLLQNQRAQLQFAISN